MKPHCYYTPRAAIGFAALFAVIVAPVLHAGPSLNVQKPPVVSGPNPNTGPGGLDPLANRGQWFLPLNGTPPQFRSHEFHDNVIGFGGGAASSRAIHGVVSNIVYLGGPGTNIIGFEIRATIINDTNTTQGGWQPGRNSHRESRPFTPNFYVGTLFRPVLAAEFALNSNALFPLGPVAGTPYVPSPGPRIVAINNDMLGWYCFNNTLPPVTGRYYVPSWQFPSIPVGGSASRQLIFRVIDGGLTPLDARYAVVVNSMAGNRDLFSNRTTSLKISNWLERLWLDNGVPYFTFGQSSDVSVFHLVPQLLPAAVR